MYVRPRNMGDSVSVARLFVFTVFVNPLKHFFTYNYPLLCHISVSDLNVDLV